VVDQSGYSVFAADSGVNSWNVEFDRKAERAVV
jgi:hypothetical protein